jgi:hypothetical protein
MRVAMTDPNAPPEIDRSDPDLTQPPYGPQTEGTAWKEGDKKPFRTNVELEAYRDLIVALALMEDDSVGPESDGTRKGAESLKSYFEKGIEGWGTPNHPTLRWTDADQKILEEARGRPKDAQWCGIFAASILNDAGLPVKFRLSRGIRTGPGITDWPPESVAGQTTDENHHVVGYHDFVNRVQPGDVVITNATYYDKKLKKNVRSYHHCIVVQVDRLNHKINCVNGNYGTKADPNMQAVKAEWRDMSDIHGGEWYNLEKLVPPK